MTRAELWALFREQLQAGELEDLEEQYPDRFRPTLPHWLHEEIQTRDTLLREALNLIPFGDPLRDSILQALGEGSDQERIEKTD